MNIEQFIGDNSSPSFIKGYPLERVKKLLEDYLLDFELENGDNPETAQVVLFEDGKVFARFVDYSGKEHAFYTEDNQEFDFFVKFQLGLLADCDEVIESFHWDIEHNYLWLIGEAN